MERAAEESARISRALGEKVAAMIRVLSKTNENREDMTWSQPGFLFFTTQQGTVKKTALEDFANVRKGGIIAIGIEQGDTLIDVKLTTGSNEVVIITKDGMSIRFNEEDVRSMGRPASGVKGITLEPGDLLATGTPEGVSALKPGDVVEVVHPEIGVLRNPVVAG